MRRPQVGQAHSGDVLPVDEDAAAGHVVHAQEEIGYSSLAGSGAADDGKFLPGLEGKAESVDGPNTGIGVLEGDVVEYDFPHDVATILGLGIDDSRLSGQELIDALLASGSLLHDTGDPADGRHGPGEHIDVDDKFGDVARADLTGHDL